MEKKRFKFEEFWLTEDSCFELVKESWESLTGLQSLNLLSRKLDKTRTVLEAWSSEKFGGLRKEIDKVSAQLASFLDESLSAEVVDSRTTLKTKLYDLLQKEHTFWRQRAKVFWLRDGDLNTKFFHQKTKNRKKKNSIHGLFNSAGVWCSSPLNIETIVISYFRELFTQSNSANCDNILGGMQSVISELDNEVLTRDIEKEEVLFALKGMHPSKSPGPDGFSPCFYQVFWEVVGNDVVAAVREFFASEAAVRKVNKTFVALIPKVDEPQHMQQLRPISLCNVIYKIGSKVLANRLKPFLDAIISPFQSAFVPGRLISDNSLMAFEVSRCLKKRRSGKVGYGALKLDMSKAYDRVEWNFLEAVMQRLGFGGT